MSPRVRLLAALLLVAILAVGASVLGSRQSPTSEADFRPSTLIATPNGTQALAETLERLGVEVERLRAHQLRKVIDAGRPAAFVVLNPTLPVTPAQVADLITLPARGVALVAAGSRARALMRCFGFDTMRVSPEAPISGGNEGAQPAPSVQVALRSIPDSVLTDSSGVFDAVVTTCRIPRDARIDTLASAGGHAEAVRVTVDGHAPVTLVADVDLFRNRTLRDSDAGAVVIPWLTTTRHVWFDEYHHGFLAGGSLAGWTLQWSRESPWGWFVWHATIVGLIAIAAGLLRFGPAESRIDRRRRSVAEHVKALARALRAAGGHRAAIGLLVAGLRRRLSPNDRRGAGTWTGWLDTVATRSRNAKIAELGNQLKRLDTERPSEGDVLSAARIVEDMWTELRS